MKKINLLFMGTTDFAAEILQELLAMTNNINIVAVVCQPDRPVGRKKAIIFSPVKTLALKHKLLILQPEKVSQEVSAFADLAIDVIITCAYGQFLSAKFLQLAKIVAINIHASLLPQLRGGAPIHWAIIKNLPETGVSLMAMNKHMDAGPVYGQKAIKISPEETYATLKLKLITLSKTILHEYLFKIISHQVTAIAQDETKVTFAYNLTRVDEKINWATSALLVSCQVRGLYDNPIAFSTVDNFVYKIHQVKITNLTSNKPAGTITNITSAGIFVATKTYDIIIEKIQPAGKQVMSANNYHGTKLQPIKIGLVFG